MACLRSVFVGMMLMLGLTSLAHATSTPGVSLLFEKIENGVVHFGLRIYVGKGRATYWHANVNPVWDEEQSAWVMANQRTMLDWSGSTGVDLSKIIIDWPFPLKVRLDDDTWTGYNEEVVLIGTAPLTEPTATLKAKVTYSHCKKTADCRRQTEQASLTVPHAVATDLTKSHIEIPMKKDPCGMRAIYEEFPDLEAPNIWRGQVVMKRSKDCMGDRILGLFEDGRFDGGGLKGTVGSDASFRPDDGQRHLEVVGQYITIVFGAVARGVGEASRRADIYQYRFRIEPGRLKPGTRL